MRLLTLVTFWTTGNCKDHFCLHQADLCEVNSIFTTPRGAENKQKSSYRTPIPIFKSHLNTCSVIDQIRFTFQILAVNADDFSFPASAGKGKGNGCLGNHYPTSLEKTNTKRKCQGKLSYPPLSSCEKQLFHSFKTWGKLKCILLSARSQCENGS